MNKLNIGSFDKGIIDAVVPEQIPDGACADIRDYEYNTSGLLSKRYSPESYELSGAGLGEVKSFCVWYSSRMPADAVSDKIFIVHADGKITTCYQGSGWVKQDIFTDVPSSLDVRFYTSYDRVLIADGLNAGRQVSVNKDKVIEYGSIGIDPPLTLLMLSAISSDSTIAEVGQADVGMGVEHGNILQYAYTVVDKYGNESNPSPISTIDDLVYRYPDAESPTGFKYYHKSVSLTGFSVERYPEAVRSKLDKYNLYRRDVPFREGVISNQFKLVRQISIGIDDTASGVDSGNDIMTDISYDNEIAPASNILIENAGVIYAGGTKKSSVRFPYEWDKYLKISITNNNNIDYCNPVVALKLNASELEIGSWEDILSNLGKVRIFFTDLTTPCKVVAWLPSGGNVLYMYVKMPYLNRNSTTPIYFTIATEKSGVARIGLWDSYNYGKFFIYEQDSMLSQPMFGDPLVDNNKQVMQLFAKPALAGLYSSFTTRLSNIADIDSIDDVFPEGYGLSENNAKRYLFYGNEHTAMTKGFLYGEGADVTFDTAANVSLPLLMHYNGRVNYEIGSYADLLKMGSLMFRVRRDAGNRLEIVFRYGASDEVVVAQTAGAITSPVSFDIMLTAYVTESAFYVILRSDYFDTDEIISTTGSLPDNITLSSTDIVVGFVDDLTNNTTLITYRASVKSADLLTNAEQYAKACRAEMWGLNYYPIPVGADQTRAIPLWDNDNIEVEAKSFEVDSQDNVLQWSAVGGENFPTLNFKAYDEPIVGVINAPSFLKQQYQNTILVFTRNSVNRVVLSDDLSTMAGAASNLISEYRSYGLYSKLSLAQAGNAFYWFSEAGVIRWSPEGFANLSRGKIVIPVSDKYLGIYLPEQGQYWLHDKTLRTTYVYHEINDAWTKFDGLFINAYAHLNLGSDVGNKLLYAYESTFQTYPSITKASNGKISTKRFFIDNMVAFRLKLFCERQTSPNLLRLTFWNEYTHINEIVHDVVSPARMKWVNLPNGLWGETVQIELDNVIGFLNMEIDFKQRR